MITRTGGTAGSRTGSRRRFMPAAVVGTAVALVMGSAAFADGVVDVSATGPADGSAVGVSGTGSASSSGGVAVSGGSNANGGAVGVTAWGDSSGGTASVDPDRTLGTVSSTGYEALEDTSGLRHTGLNQLNSLVQATDLATIPPADPVVLQQKTALLAQMLPVTASALATSGGPFWFAASPSSLDVQIEYGCVPQTLHANYFHRGMPDQYTLYARMHIYENKGATMEYAAATARRYYQGPSQGVPTYDTFEDEVGLFNRMKTSHDLWDQGVVIDVYPHLMWSWQGEELHDGSGDGHVVQVGGYSPLSGGYLLINDGINDNDSPGQPGAGYGYWHLYNLTDIWVASMGGIIW